MHTKLGTCTCVAQVWLWIQQRWAGPCVWYPSCQGNLPEEAILHGRSSWWYPSCDILLVKVIYQKKPFYMVIALDDILLVKVIYQKKPFYVVVALDDILLVKVIYQKKPLYMVVALNRKWKPGVTTTRVSTNKHDCQQWSSYIRITLGPKHFLLEWSTTKDHHKLVDSDVLFQCVSTTTTPFQLW